MVDHHSSSSIARFETSEPYNVPNRKERSRELAQKRRTTYKSLMKDLADELPFSKEVISQVDYNSRLRLALCFFKMKMLAPKKEMTSEEGGLYSNTRGLLQDLVTESLDGFIMVMSCDSSLVYISESIHKHLGLFQSEHIGLTIYELIHEDDHKSVREALAKTESKLFNRTNGIEKGSTECSFFCRMKCSRFKVSNTATKCPGYKLVFISGHYKRQGSEHCLFAVVRPVSPPSILEITMEGNMFVTHYNMEMRCIFFDGRLRHLMGYEKQDLINHVPFEFHHHDDVEANLECSRGLMEKGEGLSGYYRYLNKYGSFVWVQSRATMMFDSRTGKPSYIVCMNYVISREKGEKCLELRNSLASKENIAESARSHEPFPVPRQDGTSMNPFDIPEVAVSPAMSTAITDDDPSPSPVNSLRSISPDSSDQQIGSVTSNRSNDSGYFRPLSHESSAAMLPPIVSPTPSFTDSAIGTDYSCTNSPENVFPITTPTPKSHDIKIESCFMPSPPMSSCSCTKEPMILNMPSNVSSTNIAPSLPYPTLSPYSTTHTASPIYQQKHYVAVPPQATTAPALPFTQSTFLRQSTYFPVAVQEQYFPTQRPIYMATPTSHDNVPQLKTTTPTGSGGYSVPLNYGPQFIRHSVTGFVTTSVFSQPAPIANNMLPILNAEDVQFLDVTKCGTSNPIFQS